MSKNVQVLDQKQSMTMTTKMHQSIAVLQMSSLELSEAARRELDSNPFIEDDSIMTYQDKLHKVNSRDQQEYSSNYRSSLRSSHQDFNILDNIANEKSLKEHIAEQIYLSFDDQKHVMIAFFLLDSLDSTGYLSITTAEAAKILACDEELILSVLHDMQYFDPAGIFARDLKECLMLQIKDNEEPNKALLTMIENLDLLGTGDFKKLSRLCKIEFDEIPSLVKQIRLLSPYPANGFFIEPVSYKIPDVILTFEEEDKVKLESNSDAYPKLRVNEAYYLRVKDGVASQEDKDFTKREFEAANSLVKSIGQRTRTILKVATAIAEAQIEFFKHGVMYLKPMTLNDIAAATGFNESTVSRATANKYIATPSGTHELKFFFSSGLASTRITKNLTSSTKAKELIKQIIASEEQENILSDEDIAEQLAKLNIKVARRTIAKYRDTLNIPTAAERRRAASLKR